MTKSSQNGEYFAGAGCYVAPVFAGFTPVAAQYDDREWTFILVSQKAQFRSDSRLANSPVLIDMQADAARQRIKSGDRVKIITPDAATVGVALVRSGIATRTIGVTYSLGHWQYGAKVYIVGQKVINAQADRGGGFAFNSLGMLDPTIKDLFPIADVVGGALARNSTKARLVKL